MSIRIVAASLLIGLSPLLADASLAQERGKGGGGGRPSAPAAAPRAAPQISAPRAAPQISAPRAAPQISAPRAAPQISAPRFSAPQRSAPSFAAPRHTPQISAPRHVGRPEFRGGGRPEFRGARPEIRHARPEFRGRPSVASPRAIQRDLRASRPSAVGRNFSRAERRQVQAESRKLQADGRRLTGADRRQFRTLEARQRRELSRAARAGNVSRTQLRQMRATQQRELRNFRAERRDQRLNTERLNAQRLNGQRQALQGENRFRRGDRAQRVTALAARQGRFGASFQNRVGRERWRSDPVAWHRAWGRHHRAAFVAWLGPVFWPYAYNDIFYYTFWPDAYDEGYWAYAYDDFLDSVYWPYGNPYSEYAYAGPTPETAGIVASIPRGGSSGNIGSTGNTGGAPPAARAIQQMTAEACEPAKGITAWPFERIAGAVQPSPEQQRLLDDLRQAADKAAATFKAACTTNYPLTPPGRLEAMLNRLQASLDAIRTVRPPLEAFYNALSDEQKARFNAVGPEIGREPTRTARGDDQAKNACAEPKPGLTNLPIERIEETLQPNDRQQPALDKLSEATGKAVSILQAACPDTVSQTPPGRLAAMEQRTNAMLQAAQTVKPALDAFYATLSSEQKARFNTLGRREVRGG
jgi:hypothetical protein